MVEGGNIVYNEERKQQFLDSLQNEKSQRYIDRIKWSLKKVESYERRINKDISEFSLREIKTMYEDMRESMSTTSMIDINSSLGIYTNYINNTCEDSHFDTLKESLRAEMKREKEEKIDIISKKTIDKIIKDQKHAIDKFLIYGLYCGMKGTHYAELNFASLEDSEKDARMIWLAKASGDGECIEEKARKFYADEELYGYALAALEEDTYIYTNANDDVEVVYKLAREGKRIFKRRLPIISNKVTLGRRRVPERLKQIMQCYDETKDRSPDDIYWSGVVYNIRKIATYNNLNIRSIRDCIKSSELEPIEKQYNFKFSDRKVKASLRRYL